MGRNAFNVIIDRVISAVRVKLTDATDTNFLGIAPTGRINIIEANNKAWSDTSFVAGDGPATLNVNSGLGRNANAGFIACDGPGDIQVEISWDGTNYGDSFRMKNSEILPLDGLSVSKVKLTHTGSDSAYRVVAW